MTVLLTSEHDRAVLRSFAHRIDEQDAGAHNNLGVLYFNKGMTEEAIAALTRALELDPRMTIAQRNLEIAYFNSGFYDRRVRELTTRLAERGDDREARWELGRTSLLLGDVPRAISEFRLLLTGSAADVEVLRQLAMAEARAGDLEAATRCAQAGLALDPGHVGLLLQLGEIAYHRGLNEEARQALSRCLALAPDDADATYLLGFVNGDLGDHEAAATMTQRALRLNPALGRAHANLSLERFDARSYDKAVEAKEARGLRDEMQVSAGGQLAHFNLGLAFRQKAYHLEALREYRIALSRGEDAALVQQAMAEVHLLRKDVRSAVEMYDLLLRDQPRSPKLWNERGVALHQAGKVAEAAESYGCAVAADGAYVLALNNLAVAAYHLGNTGAAFESLRQALEVQPAFVKGRLNLALLLLRTNEHSLGLAAYRQVLRLVPDHAVAWNGVGLVLSHMRRFDDARNAFARAIESRPEYAEAHYNLSFALSNLGDYAGALRTTKRALELDPYYTPQKFELAIDLEFEDPRVEVAPELGGETRPESVDAFVFESAALESLFEDFVAVPSTRSGDEESASLRESRSQLAAGHLDGAMASVRRALAEGAPRIECLTVLADIFMRQGAWGEALERYREARTIDPSHIPAAIGEVRALVESHRFAEAEPTAGWLIGNVGHDVDALILVARVLAETDRAAEARDILQRARVLAPDRADVLTALGTVARTAGDLDTAIAAYRDAASIDRGAWQARLALAWALLERGDAEGAEAELVATLRMRPGLEDAVLSLARLLRQQGRARETVDLLADFLTGQPYHLDGLASLGESLLLLGRTADATFAFERILRFDPEHVGALYFDGALHAERHDYARALGQWARVVDLEPAGEFARRARRDTRIATDLQRIFLRPAGGRG